MLFQRPFLSFNMQKSFFLFLLFYILLSACNQPASERTGLSGAPGLDSIAQQEFIYSVIRYAGKLPGKANHRTKFDTVFDEEYRMTAARHRLDHYATDKEKNRTWFMLSRIAPSIKIKRVGVGGYVEKDADGNVLKYVEVFRTWKMEEDELAQKGKLLFNLMVKGDDLRPYYPENSGKEEYIEFPNAEAWFDTTEQRWKSSRDAVIESLYQLKEEGDSLMP